MTRTILATLLLGACTSPQVEWCSPLPADNTGVCPVACNTEAGAGDRRCAPAPFARDDTAQPAPDQPGTDPETPDQPGEEPETPQEPERPEDPEPDRASDPTAHDDWRERNGIGGA